MKWFILLLFALTPTIANSYLCSVEPNQSIDLKIQLCKLEILRTECENRGVSIKSNTTTENLRLTKDQIRSYSRCNDLKFTVTSAELNKTQDKIVVKYIMAGKSQAVEDISYQNWIDLGNIQSRSTANVETTVRDDSTSLVTIRTNIQIDSRKVRETVKTAKRKTLAAINAFIE